MWKQIGNTVYLDAWTYDMYYSNTNNWQGGKTYIRDPEYILYYQNLPPDKVDPGPQTTPELEKEYRQKTQSARDMANGFYNFSTVSSISFTGLSSGLSFVADGAEAAMNTSIMGYIFSTGLGTFLGRIVDPDLTILQKLGLTFVDGVCMAGNLLLCAFTGGSSAVVSAVVGALGSGGSMWISDELTKLAHKGFYNDGMYLY